MGKPENEYSHQPDINQQFTLELLRKINEPTLPGSMLHALSDEYNNRDWSRTKNPTLLLAALLELTFTIEPQPSIQPQQLGDFVDPAQLDSLLEIIREKYGENTRYEVVGNSHVSEGNVAADIIFPNNPNTFGYLIPAHEEVIQLTTVGTRRDGITCNNTLPSLENPQVRIHVPFPFLVPPALRHPSIPVS